jgi:hypothetical protein
VTRGHPRTRSSPSAAGTAARKERKKERKRRKKEKDKTGGGGNNMDEFVRVERIEGREREQEMVLRPPLFSIFFFLSFFLFFSFFFHSWPHLGIEEAQGIDVVLEEIAVEMVEHGRIEPRDQVLVPSNVSKDVADFLAERSMERDVSSGPRRSARSRSNLGAVGEQQVQLDDLDHRIDFEAPDAPCAPVPETNRRPGDEKKRKK